MFNSGNKNLAIIFNTKTLDRTRPFSIRYAIPISCNNENYILVPDWNIRINAHKNFIIKIHVLGGKYIPIPVPAGAISLAKNSNAFLSLCCTANHITASLTP